MAGWRTALQACTDYNTFNKSILVFSTKILFIRLSVWTKSFVILYRRTAASIAKRTCSSVAK
jgi:hypothetical protein